MAEKKALYIDGSKQPA